MNQQWLSLTDYASKYRISISTLRRRIKSGQLAHRFEDGKYLILDEAPAFSEHATPPQQASPMAGLGAAVAAAETAPFHDETQTKLNQLRPPAAGAEANVASPDEPILSSASRLLTELKRAYTNILQEKEEQIIQLKEEVTDLKTLVRVLEDDNERMRRMLK